MRNGGRAGVSVLGIESPRAIAGFHEVHGAGAAIFNHSADHSVTGAMEREGAGAAGAAAQGGVAGQAQLAGVRLDPVSVSAELRADGAGDGVRAAVVADARGVVGAAVEGDRVGNQRIVFEFEPGGGGVAVFADEHIAESQ